MKMTVYLKSGAQFSVDVENVTTRCAADGSLTDMKWTWPKDAKRELNYVRLDDVAAVVVDR